MICQSCGKECGSLSSYNADKVLECSQCHVKRIGAYGHLKHHELVKKLMDAHRELHCMKENVNGAWQQLAGANKEIDRLKQLLRQWWWYGDGTGMTTPLKDETKQVLGHLVP